MFRNLPNYLTIARILCIPIIILTFYFEDVIFARRISAFLFLIAAITDFFDGYIARKFNLQSNFGRMLDPIADKLIVSSIMIMLVKYRKINEIPCILIMMREIVVTGMREFLANTNISVPVSNLAKIKTFVQMAAIFLLLIGNKGSMLDFVDISGKILLWIAAILTVFTGYSYFRCYMRSAI
jgi:cardiolipin synthase